MKFLLFFFLTVFCCLFLLCATQVFVSAEDPDEQAEEAAELEELRQTRQKIRKVSRPLAEKPPPMPNIEDLDLFEFKKPVPPFPANRAIVSAPLTVAVAVAFRFFWKKKYVDMKSVVVCALLLVANVAQFALKAKNLSAYAAYLQVLIFLVPVGLSSAVGIFTKVFTLSEEDATKNGTIFVAEDLAALPTITPDNVADLVQKMKKTVDSNLLKSEIQAAVTQKYQTIHDSLKDAIGKAYSPTELARLLALIDFVASMYSDGSKNADMQALKSLINLQKIAHFIFDSEELTLDALNEFHALALQGGADAKELAEKRLAKYLADRQAAVSMNGIDMNGFVNELLDLLGNKKPSVAFFKDVIQAEMDKAFQVKKILKGELNKSSSFENFKSFITFQMDEYDKTKDKGTLKLLQISILTLREKLAPLVAITDVTHVDNYKVQLQDVEDALEELDFLKEKKMHEFGLGEKIESNDPNAGCVVDMEALEEAKTVLESPEAEIYSHKFSKLGDIGETEDFLTNYQEAGINTDVIIAVYDRYLTKELEKCKGNETMLDEYASIMKNLADEFDSPHIFHNIIRGHMYQAKMDVIMAPVQKSRDWETILAALKKLSELTFLNDEGASLIVESTLEALTDAFKKSVAPLLSINVDAENFDPDYDYEEYRKLMKGLKDIRTITYGSLGFIGSSASDDFVLKEQYDALKIIPKLCDTQYRTLKIIESSASNTDFEFDARYLYGLYELVFNGSPFIGTAKAFFRQAIERMNAEVDKYSGKLKELKNFAGLFDYYCKKFKHLTNEDLKIEGGNLGDKPFGIMRNRIGDLITALQN